MKPVRVKPAPADDDVMHLAAMVVALTKRVKKLEYEFERLRIARLANELIPQCWRKL